jgi:methenyltetrahydrofolate cyclohydrolase
MYIDQPLRKFLDELASSAPTPGGGSVAALTGALSAGLVTMVASLTLGKEKYAAVQPQVQALAKAAEALRTGLQDLIQQDIVVFGALSAVYKMPKNTDAEKAARTARMQSALKSACQVPVDIALKSVEVAGLTRTAAEIGNTAAVSDAGVAVLLARACAHSAALNVKINLNSIKDEEYNRTTWARISEILSQVDKLEREVVDLTYRKMG